MNFKLIYQNYSDFVDPSGKLHIFDNFKEAIWAADIYTDVVGKPLVPVRITEFYED